MKNLKAIGVRCGLPGGKAKNTGPTYFCKLSTPLYLILLGCTLTARFLGLPDSTSGI